MVVLGGDGLLWLVRVVSGGGGWLLQVVGVGGGWWFWVVLVVTPISTMKAKRALLCEKGSPSP